MTARVLVVEDNPTNRALMEYLLRAFGYTVLTASDGAEGLEAAARETPDLILMDLEMPKMNGFEAARRLKADPRLCRIPLVAVTALAMVGDREKILALGFNGYVAKPIAPETFLQDLQKHLGAAASAQATGGAEPAPSVPHTSNGAPPREHARPARRGVVLVVDNSPANRALLASTLEPLGYRALVASSAAEAFDIARRNPLDLILSDVHMPKVSGLELARALNADEELRAIPFALISSSVPSSAEHREAAELGVERVLVRPIEPEELIAYLDSRLDRDSADRS